MVYLSTSLKFLKYHFQGLSFPFIVHLIEICLPSIILKLISVNIESVLNLSITLTSKKPLNGNSFL